MELLTKEKVSGLLKAHQERLAKLLPATVARNDADRERASKRISEAFLTCCMKNPDLLKCHPESIKQAIRELAELGIVPDTHLGYAYLIPWDHKENGKVIWTECQMAIGYKGMLHLVRQDPEVANVLAGAVYEGDEWELELGQDPKMIHRPSVSAERSELLFTYCVVDKVNGRRIVSHCPIWKIQHHRKRSKQKKAGGPWDTDFDAMAIKTAVRSLAPYLELRPTVGAAIQRDDYRDKGIEGPPGSLDFETLEVSGSDTAPAGLKSRMAERAASAAEHAKEESAAPKNRTLDPDVGGEEPAPIEGGLFNE